MTYIPRSVADGWELIPLTRTDTEYLELITRINTKKRRAINTDDEWIDPRENFDNLLHCVDFNIAKSLLGKQVLCFVGQGDITLKDFDAHTFKHIMMQLDSDYIDPSTPTKSNSSWDDPHRFVMIDKPIKENHMYLSFVDDDMPYIYAYGEYDYFGTGSGSDPIYILGKWRFQPES